jgi:hypothetical protein
MAAYPFTPAIKYAALKERLQAEFNCKLLKVEGKIKDLQGGEHDVYYFERSHEGKVYRAAAPDLADETPVLYSVIRSLCTRLHIEPAKFGLNLG